MSTGKQPSDLESNSLEFESMMQEFREDAKRGFELLKTSPFKERMECFKNKLKEL